LQTEATAPISAWPGPLCRRVADLCHRIAFRERQLNDQLASLVRALDEPVRVAFAGRVSIGKSTLVNALLQAPVAPTGDIETTRVVTRFETGDYEEVELGLRDGTTRQAFLTPAGVLPPAYPFPIESVQEVRVRLPYAPLLRRITIIDTPGLESLNEEASDRTSESLFSRDSRTAIAAADALVYLLRTDSENDAVAVAAFTELTGVDFCALNAVGVLNCKTEHTLAEQGRVALRLKGEPSFRNRVTDVIPVFGLLAFAVQAALLNDRDAANLRTLAGEDEDLLIDVDEFLEAPSGVARHERQRLLDLIGFNGLRVALQTARSTSGGLEDINAGLLVESGLPRLLEVIDGTFASCADQIKAGQTLAAVNRLSYQADAEGGRSARRMIEMLRSDPGMHGIQELWALQQCARPDVEIAEWVALELARVATGTALSAKAGLAGDATPEQILAAAQAGASRAHSYAAGMSVTRPEARIAETLRRSYTNIYRDVHRTASMGGAHE
jgi:hypothetical protein